MSDLKSVLGEAVGAAFAAGGMAKELGRVTVSDRPDLADFQSNGALAAAKAPLDWKSARSGRSDTVTRPSSLAMPPAAKAAPTASPRTLLRSLIGRRSGPCWRPRRRWP